MTRQKRAEGPTYPCHKNVLPDGPAPRGAGVHTPFYCFAPSHTDNPARTTPKNRTKCLGYSTISEARRSGPGTSLLVPGYSV